MLGVAVLASVFTSHGGYSSPAAFVSGLHPTLWIAVAVLACGALQPVGLPFDTSSAARMDRASPATDGTDQADGPQSEPAGAERPQGRAPIGTGVSVA